MELQIDGALDGPWDKLGGIIVAAGQEDASGFRRHLAIQLAKRDYQGMMRDMQINCTWGQQEDFALRFHGEMELLRQEFVDAFGEPEGTT
jgi:hypothetical protein